MKTDAKNYKKQAHIALKYGFFFLGASLICSWQGCKEDPVNPEDPGGIVVVDPPGPGDSEDNSLDLFVAPDYSDDYAAIAAWGERNRWNLANVHDPTVEKCGDYYYMYQTDASYGNAHEGHGHFFCRRSKDLVNWEFRGATQSDVLPWVKDTLNNMRSRLGLPAINNPSYGYWAPVVRKAGNKYWMYYTIVIDNYIQTGKSATSANFDYSWTERAFIGLMETDDLASNLWTDRGMVVCSSSDRGTNWSRPSLNNWDAYFKWNAIDPSFIITPEGERWLIYGSWHSGIVALLLDPETGKPAHLGDPWATGALPDYGTRIYTRDGNSRWQASEAPEIIYNGETGYYYLFLAYDELSVAYNTRVCRSRSITGPYTGYNHADVSAGGNVYPLLTHPYQFNRHSGWVGISHCCIFQDGDGHWYYSSQGRLPANTNGNAYSNAIMMGHVRKIRWTDDGWPVVMPERYAAVPDVSIQEDELTGTWEHITLKYAIGKQQTSQTLTLAGNHTATGALSGAWSWDSGNKILTIGNQKLYVEREADWEASPRHHTLIYAGLNSSGESLWGKQSR
ncbi:MAG: arabinan endo-1,5-alpha-L-arabinosidase [Dysgonamonadaceae bacterium]|jgi:arabinan endo-1,5-alpha-L-arabinosidase|nr:arabinan endo-1,5-alpha-L-arabinosidase [Dysgonamonadaceae bacterium]